MVAETFRICICPEAVTSQTRPTQTKNKERKKMKKNIKTAILLGFPVLGHPVLNVLGDPLAFPLSHVHQENATIEDALLWPQT